MRKKFDETWKEVAGDESDAEINEKCFVQFLEESMKKGYLSFGLQFQIEVERIMAAKKKQAFTKESLANRMAAYRVDQLFPGGGWEFKSRWWDDFKPAEAS